MNNVFYQPSRAALKNFYFEIDWKNFFGAFLPVVYITQLLSILARERWDDDVEYVRIEKRIYYMYIPKYIQ